MHDREAPTPQPGEYEITARVAEPRTPIPVPGGRWMAWLLPMLSALVAAGVLLGTLGRAFYVLREEYMISETANAVTHAKLTEVIAGVDRNLTAQTQAMRDMSGALQAQAVQLAAIRAHEK